MVCVVTYLPLLAIFALSFPISDLFTGSDYSEPGKQLGQDEVETG